MTNEEFKELVNMKSKEATTQVLDLYNTMQATYNEIVEQLKLASLYEIPSEVFEISEAVKKMEAIFNQVDYQRKMKIDAENVKSTEVPLPKNTALDGMQQL